MTRPAAQGTLDALVGRRQVLVRATGATVTVRLKPTFLYSMLLIHECTVSLEDLII